MHQLFIFLVFFGMIFFVTTPFIANLYEYLCDYKNFHGSRSSFHIALVIVIFLINLLIGVVGYIFWEGIGAIL